MGGPSYPAPKGGQYATTAMWTTAVHGIVGGRSLYPSATTPVPNEGVKLGEIEAWRCWKIEDNFLFSAFNYYHQDGLWPPGEIMTAEMSPESIGIHAWKTREQALKYLLEFNDRGSSRDMDFALGKVSLWGRIVEHEYGYLAEHARVMMVEATLKNNGEVLNAIQARYGLPLTPMVEVEVASMINAEMVLAMTMIRQRPDPPSTALDKAINLILLITTWLNFGAMWAAVSQGRVGASILHGLAAAAASAIFFWKK